MADLIDRQELLKRLNTKWEDAVTAIKKSPAVDAEPVKHGRWIRNNIDRPMFAICSECKTVWYNEYNHCPHCGAKIDLEVEAC